jgi:hypothetical protein
MKVFLDDQLHTCRGHIPRLPNLQLQRQRCRELERQRCKNLQRQE